MRPVQSRTGRTAFGSSPPAETSTALPRTGTAQLRSPGRSHASAGYPGGHYAGRSRWLHSAVSRSTGHMIRTRRNGGRGAAAVSDLCFLSNFQPLLQYLAGRLLIIIEGMGVDVQRDGRPAVAQQTRCRGHISSAGDQEAGVGVLQGVDIQCSRQVILLQNQLEPSGEGVGVIGSRYPWRRKMWSVSSSFRLSEIPVSQGHSRWNSFSRDSISREKHTYRSPVTVFVSLTMMSLPVTFTIFRWMRMLHFYRLMCLSMDLQQKASTASSA